MDSNKNIQSKNRPRSILRSRSSVERKSYRNPYLNFIRDFRKDSSSTLTYKEVLIRAGKTWRKMSAKQKQCYIEEASMVSRDSPPKKDTKKKPKGTSDKKKNTKNNKKKPSHRRKMESDSASDSLYDSDYSQRSR